jgi:hypothetical protein
LGLWGGSPAAAAAASGGGSGAAGSTLQMYSYQPPSEDLLMVSGPCMHAPPAPRYICHQKPGAACHHCPTVTTASSNCH